MDTDPNPFRDSPDSDRSPSPTEAPDDDTRDFTIEEATNSTSTGNSSPMNADSDGDLSDSATGSTTSSATDDVPSSQTGANNGNSAGSTQPI